MDKNIINAEYRTKETIIAEVKATIDHVETTAMFGAIRIGKCYTELKELIPHGGWYKFIEENTGHSPKKVERFMKIAVEYGDESTPLGSLFSKTTISSDLSIYKALTLIALPDEEVESFIEENDIGGMTVKELEEKVKSLSKEINDSYKGLEELGDDLLAAVKEKEQLSNEVKELNDKLAGLEAAGADAEGGISEEAQAEIDRIRMEKLEEIKQIAKEKEAVESKADKLKDQIDKLKIDQQKIIEKEKEKAAAEAKAEAKKETDEEIKKLMEISDNATKAKLEAEKKLAASSNEDLTKCKIRVVQMQEAFNDAINLLSDIEKNEPDQGVKLRAGLKAILGKLQEQL